MPSQEPCGACLLCGKAIADGPGDFCCEGCSRVHTVITGLDATAGAEYLAAARALGIVPRGETTPATSAAETPPDPAAEREERFAAEGLSCPSCAWVIERVLTAQSGVREANFDFLTGTGRVRYDLRRTSPDRLGELLRPLGYRLTPVTGGTDHEVTHGITLGFAICAVISMNLMCLSALRYGHDLGWIDVVPAWVPWVEFLLCAPVMLVGLSPIGRRAWQGLRMRRLTMDALIALSAGAAFVLSCAALWSGRSDIYFETAAGLVTISLLSRMIEARLRRRALRDTAALMRLDVARARLAEPGPNGREQYMPVPEIASGAVLSFRKDELVPFDGEAKLPPGATCLVSEAVLTGEPHPIRKVTGDSIIAGSTVVEGELLLTVSRGFAQTRLHQIAAGIRAGLASRESELRSADRIATWFVPAVLALAVGAWLLRWALFGLPYALSASGWFPSVAVLAVACPCAFSLAGVTAVAAATWSLVSRGFLVREGIQFERLPRTTTVVFDKTRTLTEGELGLAGLSWRNQAQDHLLPLILAAEAHCDHPVARALRADLLARGVPAPTEEFPVEDLPGQGRRLADDDGQFTVGATSLFADGFPVPAVAANHSLVWFGRHGRAEGCFHFTDRLRPDAVAAVRGLRDKGLRVELLSGDRQEVCDQLAATLCTDRAVGGATLDAKVAHIRDLRQRGERVLYVGDGTNDALAMSGADASIAIAGSADEALAASGFVMLHGRLMALPELFDTARRLSRTVLGNNVWAFAFNGLFLPVAAAGRLTPLAAMLLMLASSTGVLLNSLRLLRR